MDNNTFQLAIAVVASLQVVALAWIGWKAQVAASNAHDAKVQVGVVHDLVNSLSNKKDDALTEAATKAGELAGRDFEAAKQLAAAPQLPTPVTIVDTGTTLPVHEVGEEPKP